MAPKCKEVGSRRHGNLDRLLIIDCQKTWVFRYLKLNCDRLWQKQAEVANDKTAEMSLNTIQV